MRIKERSDFFKVHGQDMAINEVISILSKVPSYEIVELFGKSNKLIPREARMRVLRSVLDEEVRKVRIRNISLSDEVSHRLNWYNNYSEFQLQELIPLFNDPSNVLTKYFIEDTWLMLLQIAPALGVTDQELEDLIHSAIAKRNDSLETARDFNKTLDSIFGDRKKEIDGIPEKTFRDTLENSSTVAELRNLAKKYKINVPSRVKKAELIELILDYLESKKKINREELKAELSKKSVIQIQRFAKDNDIKASTELKKSEIIEYIVGNFEHPKQEVIDLPEFNLPSRFVFVEPKYSAPKEVIVEKIVEVGEPAKKEYKVFFKESETVTKVQTVFEDYIPVEPKDPVKEGYNFVAWYTEPEFINKYLFDKPLEDDLRLYAKFEPIDKVKEIKEYTISFVYNEIDIKEQTIIEGKKIVEPKDPIKEGYKFLGWYIDKELTYKFDFDLIIHKDLTLYPKFEKEEQKEDISDISLLKKELQEIKELLQNQKQVIIIQDGRQVEKIADDVQTVDVVFNTQGGTNVNPFKVVAGSTIPAPHSPYKEGYRFLYWAKSLEKKKEFDFNQPIDKNWTLYAIYEELPAEVQINLVNVNYDTQGGDELYPTTIQEGDILQKPFDPSRENSIFLHWTDNLETKEPFNFDLPIQQDLTLYAVYQDYVPEEPVEMNLVNVFFDTRGADDLFPITIDSGKTIQVPLSPSKENYSFLYWTSNPETNEPFNFEEPILEDTTLYAVFEEITRYVNVFFDTKGAIELEPVTIELGHVVQVPVTPQKEGYNFLYWTSNLETNEPFDFELPLQEDTTLYAIYEEVVLEDPVVSEEPIASVETSVVEEPKNIEKVTVVFDAKGIINIKPQEIEKGNKAEKAFNPGNENNKFLYWSKEIGGKEFDFNTEINEDLILYAVYETFDSSKEFVTISFETDGGDYVPDLKVEKNKKINIESVSKKKDMIFKHWSTKRDGKKAFKNNSKAKKDLTLYAVFMNEKQAKKYFKKKRGKKTNFILRLFKFLVFLLILAILALLAIFLIGYFEIFGNNFITAPESIKDILIAINNFTKSIINIF